MGGIQIKEKLCVFISNKVLLNGEDIIIFFKIHLLKHLLKQLKIIHLIYLKIIYVYFLKKMKVIIKYYFVHVKNILNLKKMEFY